MEYKCPVCGYNKLKKPLYDENGYGTYEICVCCGFEFGSDDFPDKEMAYSKWRENWQKEGCRWFSSYAKQPKNWNAKEQLTSLNYNQDGYQNKQQ